MSTQSNRLNLNSNVFLSDTMFWLVVLLFLSVDSVVILLLENYRGN